MALDLKTAKYIAELAAIRLSDEELESIRRDLSETLDYVAHLSSVNTEGVEETSHVHGAVNAFREDVVKPSFDRQVVEELAPDFAQGGFRVPRII